MKTDEYSSWLAAAGKQDPWPVVAIYDRGMTLGGLAAQLKAHGSEVLHLADEHWFTGLAKDHAIGLAIVHCDGHDASALRLCDEIRSSARGFFLPILLVIPDQDQILLNFARSCSADMVIPSCEGIDYTALRAMDLLRTPRSRGPWTMFGWMAVNARDKKAVSSGHLITMQPVPFELYRTILERPLETHSLPSLATRLRDAGIGRSQPPNMSKVLTAIRHAFESREELFPLRTIYGEGYRLELGVRNNPERYRGKPRGAAVRRRFGRCLITSRPARIASRSPAGGRHHGDAVATNAFRLRDARILADSRGKSLRADAPCRPVSAPYRGTTAGLIDFG